ncbi:transmembrane protein 249 [Oncorhynchus tshawytscha]|uniref:transmembrane protein 249 n=1 Tax=Oncorhynchus tshawytscha TaxID=74940 RepID=UPI001C3C785A|nr:transmembrane protein 249 [Oncorhynchus tshawytscha]
MTIGIFGTWDHQFNATEQALTDKIKNNPCYPFTIVKDEAYLFLVQDHHKYTGFLVFSMCLSLWLVCSGAFRRRLVIDHKKKEYRYYIHTHLRHRGPLHQIYIRMIAQKSGQVLLMYKLMLNGYKIEERELSGFSEKYELLECQGRRIATKLNLNYFDYQDTSKRHLVIHRPKIILSANNDRNNPPV